MATKDQHERKTTPQNADENTNIQGENDSKIDDELTRKIKSLRGTIQTKDYIIDDFSRNLVRLKIRGTNSKRNTKTHGQRQRQPTKKYYG